MDETRRLVLITGGGTGGHIFPGLAAAEALRQEGARVHWLGTRRGMESRLVPAADIPISYLRVDGVRGKSGWRQLLVPLLLLAAIAQAILLIYRLKPSCVLGTGGFVAGPGGIAAWLLGAPLVLHEQNAVAGTTNRLLARLARRILLGLPGPFSGNPKALVVGNPVRAVITQMANPDMRLQGRSGPLRVLVVGGSQGANALNRVVPEAIAQVPVAQRPEVWHQTGEREQAECSQRYAALGLTARTSAFIADMVEAYSWADVVVCRAGALTVSELAAAGVASILVPLPNAIDDHQNANARWLSDVAAAYCITQRDFTPAWLGAQLLRWIPDRTELLAMSVRARGMARPDAACRVAGCCLELAR